MEFSLNSLFHKLYHRISYFIPSLIKNSLHGKNLKMVVIVESKPSLSVLIVMSLIYTGKTILILYDGFTSPTGKNTKFNMQLRAEQTAPLGQNLSLKCLQSLEQRMSQQKRFRSFKRGTVSLCRSKGCKTTSCQSWRSEKNPAARPTLHYAHAAQVRFPDDKIILQL